MKRTALRRVTPLRTTKLNRGPVRRSQGTLDPVGATTRQLVHERSGGRCELRGCHEEATHLHHRQLRRFGNHTPANLLDVCARCHDLIHSSTMTDAARQWGLLLKSHQEPTQTPVILRHGWVLLDAEGGLTHCPLD